MLRKWIIWSAAGILLLALFLQINLDELYLSLAQIDWKVIGLLLLLQIVTQLLLNLQWQRIAVFVGVKLSFWTMFYINAQGSVMESITPGVKVGGEITRGVQLARLGRCSGSTAAVVVVLQKIFSLSAFALINIFAAVYLSHRSSILDSSLSRLIVYTFLGLVLAAFALILIMPKQLLARINNKPPVRTWLGAVRRFVENLLEHIVMFESRKQELVIQFILALAIWLLYPLKLYLLTAQVLPDAPLVYITSITFISYLVGMLPLFPGGLGGFEGTMSGLLTGIGLSLSSSAAVAVIFRFITFWFVIITSLAFTAVYKLAYKNTSQVERMLPNEK
ncbi:MAG: YbhN family protein [Candidatus Wallacebacter cryptica]|jgi:uncharacterized protein (TIRG00374 family)|nr:flippase-like domain-containing protein [Bacillota bacterium]